MHATFEVTGNVLTSPYARLSNFDKVSARYVVMMRTADGANFVVGQFWLLFSNADDCHALVSLWELKSHSEALGTATWRMTDSPFVVPLGEILSSVIWYESSAGIARILIPYQYRGLQTVAA